jgi:hypothetical protein
MGEPESGESPAPGLKLKSGRAMGLRDLSTLLGGMFGSWLCGSMADIGSRPVARDREGGAEVGDAMRAGKTKGGLGNGSEASLIADMCSEDS